MSAAPKDSDGPTAGTRTARLAEVWDAANALAAAAQMPKQLSGSTRPSDISFESTNSVDHSSPIPLRHRGLVDVAIAPTSPSRWRLVAGFCLIAVILTGGTSAVIAFRQFPLADIWRDHVSSWTDSKRPASTMGRQQGFPRLRIETSRGMSGDPVKLALAIEGSAEGAVVIITGVLAGMEISTGNEVAAHRWEVLPDDVPYTFVAPPEKFVGSVSLVAELRLANDKIVDRQPVYLEWAPPSPPGPAENQYNREEPAGPNRRVEDDPNREKAAAISSSASPRPEWQEAMVSSSPPVERNPDREETAAISNSSAPAQNQVRREEAMVPPSFPRNAPAIPKALSEGGSDFAIKQRKNAWTVGVAGGIIDGTYMRFADELGKVLDDGDNLRILPMVSYGAASNLADLLYLRGVDVAVTQSDVFEYFRTERKTINLQNRVHYLLRLPIAELHILAKTDIRSLEDLRRKKVNFGPAGSGSSLTGTIVFQRLGVEVEQVLIDQPTALQKLQSGEVAALVRVVGKPVEFFTRIPPNSGLHLVPIPFTKTFADFYTLGEFESKDYPSLVPNGTTVDTIAVPTVLAVFNWPKGSDRYRRIERFSERLFTHWDKFLVPPRHPKWREVNLGGTVPGWTRHIIAEQMLERFYGPSRSSPQDIRRDFQVFLDRVGTGGPQSQADREALFRQFLKWREQQAGQTR